MGGAPSELEGGYRLSAVIMSHPTRARLVERLQRSCPTLDFQVVMDDSAQPSPDGALATALRAWSSVVDDATHHLVLQDDVIPCLDFAVRLSRAIGSDPDRVFSLFSEWGSKTAQMIRIAALGGYGWATVADAFLPAPAVLMPAESAVEFARFLALRLAEGEKRDAFLLLHYLRDHGRQPQVCVPNLVQHDDPLQASLLPNGKVRGPRRTACYPGSAALPDPWPPQIRQLPQYLPYHSPHDLVANVCFSPDADQGWQTVPAFAWLAERGWSLTDLDELFRESIRIAGLQLDDEPLGYDSLKESVISAFVTGWVLDEGQDLRAFDPDHLSAIQLSALGTMAAGPFRRVLSVRQLNHLETAMRPLLTNAILRGMEARDAAGGPAHGRAPQCAA
ncbi:hypothetical protein [Krasilnikovia sp. M28-CT-15]|uniref:hypothetical protein n=1 Tax=Krasilnikovia sp. M28-CT-15 TaxID=3373540 RepID=UPI0038778A2E